jgi:hypothetical protein
VCPNQWALQAIGWQQGSGTSRLPSWWAPKEVTQEKTLHEVPMKKLEQATPQLTIEVLWSPEHSITFCTLTCFWLGGLK